MRNSILLDDHLPILLQTTLFHGLSLAELRMTMECFQPAARAFSPRRSVSTRQRLTASGRNTKTEACSPIH